MSIFEWPFYTGFTVYLYIDELLSYIKSAIIGRHLYFYKKCVTDIYNEYLIRKCQYMRSFFSFLVISL